MGVPSWAIGAIINVVGNIMISLGQNLMKLGFNQREEMDVPEEEERPGITRFKWWWIGLVTFGVGTLANFVSFGFAAQSLLAALGAIQFVCAIIFSALVLKEKITIYSLLSTAFIIGGSLLLVIFGNHDSQEYSVEELTDLYEGIPYIIYLVVGALLVVGAYVAYLKGKVVCELPGRETSAWVRMMPVAYSLFSALIGTQSVIFAKSLSVLLRMTINGDNQFTNWYTWVTLLVFIIAAAFWTMRLNQGLAMFPVMVISPMLQICWVILATLSGMLYFQEYLGFNALMASMFALGMFIILVGVFLLTLHAKRVATILLEEQLLLGPEGREGSVVLSDNPAFDHLNITRWHSKANLSPGAGKRSGGGGISVFDSYGGAPTSEYSSAVGGGTGGGTGALAETMKKRDLLGATMRLTQGMAATLPSGFAEARRAQAQAQAAGVRRSMALNSTFASSAEGHSAGGAHLQHSDRTETSAGGAGPHNSRRNGNLNKTMSPTAAFGGGGGFGARRYHDRDLGATMSSNASVGTHTSSKMSTLRNNMKQDWKIFDTALTKMAIADGSLALSVFSIPSGPNSSLRGHHQTYNVRASGGGVSSVGGSAGGHGPSHGPDGAERVHSSGHILSALPQSRFYHADLEPIRELGSEVGYGEGYGKRNSSGTPHGGPESVPSDDLRQSDDAVGGQRGGGGRGGETGSGRLASRAQKLSVVVGEGEGPAAGPGSPRLVKFAVGGAPLPFGDSPERYQGGFEGGNNNTYGAGLADAAAGNQQASMVGMNDRATRSRDQRQDRDGDRDPQDRHQLDRRHEQERQGQRDEASHVSLEARSSPEQQQQQQRQQRRAGDSQRDASDLGELPAVWTGPSGRSSPRRRGSDPGQKGAGSRGGSGGSSSGGGGGGVSAAPPADIWLPLRSPLLQQEQEQAWQQQQQAWQGAQQSEQQQQQAWQQAQQQGSVVMPPSYGGGSPLMPTMASPPSPYLALTGGGMIQLQQLQPQDTWLPLTLAATAALHPSSPDLPLQSPERQLPPRPSDLWLPQQHLGTWDGRAGSASIGTPPSQAQALPSAPWRASIASASSVPAAIAPLVPLVPPLLQRPSTASGARTSSPPQSYLQMLEHGPSLYMPLTSGQAQVGGGAVSMATPIPWASQPSLAPLVGMAAGIGGLSPSQGSVGSGYLALLQGPSGPGQGYAPAPILQARAPSRAVALSSAGIAASSPGAVLAHARRNSLGPLSSFVASPSSGLQPQTYSQPQPGQQFYAAGLSPRLAAPAHAWTETSGAGDAQAAMLQGRSLTPQGSWGSGSVVGAVGRIGGNSAAPRGGSPGGQRARSPSRLSVSRSWARDR